MSHLTRTVVGQALASTLATAITKTVPDSGGQFAVAAATGWPTTNFVVVVDRSGSEEKILCSSRTGTSCTVAAGGRGYDGTTIQAHAVTVTVEPEIDTNIYTALLEHVNTDAGMDHAAYEKVTNSGLVTDVGALAWGNSAVVGAVGRWADAGHQHPFPNKATFTATQSSGANQFPNTATATKVILQSFASDNYSGGDTVNSRYTVPSGWAGQWLFAAWMSWQANATGYRELMLYKNGAKVADHQIMSYGATTDIFVPLVSLQNGVVAGDYFELGVNQTSGGTLQIGGLEQGMGFSGLWVRP